MPKAAPRAGGFTLVELLIALVMMALMASVLFGTLRLAGRSWEAGEARVEEGANARLAQQFLRTHLTQHYPLRMRKEPEQPLFFEGDASSMRFASVLPDRVAGGGTFLLRLAVASDGERNPLVMYRLIPDGPVTRETSFADAQASVLVGDVKAVRFAYFGSESERDEPRWFDRWDDPQRLPALIRVEVEPRKGAAWPALVVEPQLALEAGCPRWNAAQQRCVGP